MRFVALLGGGHNIAVWIWSLFFLPGTIVHELSHFFAAAMTGARTGKVEIFPEFLDDSKKSGSVALGYVQTQKLNLVQGFIVGVAPFISGLVLLVYLASQIPNAYFSGDIATLLFQIYLFFVFANSFFLSWSDVRQVLPLVIISIISVIFISIAGISWQIPKFDNQVQTLNTLSLTILISAGLDLIITVFIWISSLFVKKIKYS